MVGTCAAGARLTGGGLNACTMRAHTSSALARAVGSASGARPRRIISRSASVSGAELVCAVVAEDVDASASIGVGAAFGMIGGSVAVHGAGLLSCEVGRSDIERLRARCPQGIAPSWVESVEAIN